METTLAVRQHTRAERELAEQLRFEAALSRAVLSSVPGKVAVVDRAGTVIRVNDAWSPGDLVAGGSEVAVGASYLDVCRAAASSGPASQEMAQGIEAVLAGGHPSGFRMEYPSPLPSGERWHELAVQPLQCPEGGAVLTFADCTARKRAELEAQVHWAGAVHATRAATLGEMSAGLAHELNQPLAAILTNVHASLRILAVRPLQVELLREILEDIAADDLRASEIIRRMRAFLKKGQTEVEPLDLTDLARGVVGLVASDAILRRARIHPHLEPGLPRVSGDRVQLQQVILNLVVNGLEAMAETAPARRHLVIRTAQSEERWVEVTVEDGGPGIAPEVLARIYEPFFTTKRDGLGMGLSISQSIAEAHGGHLSASNNPGGGAMFTLRLPVAAAPRSLAGAAVELQSR
jgi:C4-dicarboxylate-specific signal transduction histidine kinase